MRYFPSILYGAAVLITLILLAFFIFRSDDADSSVHIAVHEEFTGSTDTDGDGTPDWLEDITGFDSFNATSFPYQKDIIEANIVSVNNLLYGGPGGVTDEIVTRILTSDSDISLTTDEEDAFVNVSAAYFLRKVEERGFPPVLISTDDSVSRSDILTQFVSALDHLTGISEYGIERLVLEVFAKNTSIFDEAQAMRDACRYVLAHLPRTIPSAAYDSYYLVIERITYLCESLYISLSDASPENYFYFLKLTTSGELFERMAGMESITDETAHIVFINAVASVIQTLQE